MPNYAQRKNFNQLRASKKRKLTIEQNIQRMLAQEAVADANENITNNNSLPLNEPMEESLAEERPSAGDGASLSDGDDSFAPPSDRSMSSDDDSNPNDFGFDDIFGFGQFDDQTSSDDDGDSPDGTLPSDSSRHGEDDVVDATPATMVYQDDDEKPTIAENEVEFSELEVAQLDLLMLCDASGATREFHDKLLSLLRRLRKKGVDITKAKNRASFMATMESKVKCPKPVSKKVDGRDVLYFPFFDSLKDLFRSSAFYEIDNLCANKQEDERFQRFQPTTEADSSEIMSNEWAIQTQDNLAADEDFDPELDFFVALQMYGDKTGTDVNQRYPLEPWMFTLVVLRLSARENPNNWRHLGFIPSQDFVPSNSSSAVKLSSEDKLQQYHDYMSVLLQEVKDVSKAKPMMWVNLGGIWKKKRVRVYLAVVSGDQKSQDFLCGRKAINNGSAGRVHRGCMASAVNSTAVGSGGVLHGGCQKPPIEVLNRLNYLALMDVTDDAQSGPMAIVNKILPVDTAKQRRAKKLPSATFLLLK